jgi:hypothetical protein
MAMRSSDPALANPLISQYEMSKHLCDRLGYALLEADRHFADEVNQPVGAVLTLWTEAWVPAVLAKVSAARRC